jgi:AAA domain
MLEPSVLDTFKKAEPFPYSAVGKLSNETLPEIIQGILGPQSVGVMAGVPNAGKTFLGLDLAAHVAANQPWFGRKVTGGPVLYVASEAPGSVKIRARVVVSEKFKDKPSLPLYIVTAAPALGDEVEHVAECSRLLATIQAIQSDEGETVRLVVIDTLASVLGGGEENSNGMLLVAKCAKYLATNTEAAVLLIHHPNKGDATSLRGHSSLSGAVDTIISISSDEATGIRTATLTKSRDSAAGVHIEFKLEIITLPDPDCFGDPRTTCIVRSVLLSEVPRKRPTGKAQEQLLNELERRYRAGETSWDLATVRKAGREIGMYRNSPAVALAGLQRSGFVAGSEAQLVLKYPPERFS